MTRGLWVRVDVGMGTGKPKTTCGLPVPHPRDSGVGADAGRDSGAGTDTAFSLKIEFRKNFHLAGIYRKNVLEVTFANYG